MKVRVQTTQADSILDKTVLDVVLKFMFIGHEQYWHHDITINMIGMNAMEFGIPGRRPHEIDHIIVECGNKTWRLEGHLDNQGELVPITVYNGKRPYWTWRLRQKALGMK